MYVLTYETYMHVIRQCVYVDCKIKTAVIDRDAGHGNCGHQDDCFGDDQRWSPVQYHASYDPKPLTLNPEPLTFNPKPLTLNP